ncbi:MAG: HEAT repeat domain-containing protein [Nannocystaceae bacterium]|nr:HEAT repeat domain-containing protein [Nannocystaceae bacterium]
MKTFTTTLLVLLAALGCACGEPTAFTPAPTVAAAEPLAPVLRPGEVHVYRIDWQTEATRSREGNTALSGGVTLGGELAISAIGREAGGTRVSVWFPRLDTHAIVGGGERIELDAATLVGEHAELVVADDGDVRQAFFRPESAPIFRELMTGVIARLDLRGATPDGQPRTVRGGHGLVEASYRRDGDGVVHRELAGVLRFDTVPGEQVDARALSAEATIELDAERVPVRIELHDSASLAESHGFVSDDRFTLQRTRVEHGSPTPLEHAQSIDPTAGPDLVAAARELDRQYAGNTHPQDIAIAMRALDGGLLPHHGQLSRFAAFLRAYPERTRELIPLVLDADDGGRQLGFDVLAAAGTPEAQQVMRELLVDPAGATWTQRELLLQRFAFVVAPSAESGEFLLTQLELASAAGELQTVEALLYPIGTVTGRVRDAWLAERMHDVLVRAAADEDTRVRAAAVAGLGNARRDDDVPRIIAAASDAASTVRLEALASLRTHVEPRATATLLDALGDADPDVASRALMVLRKRHFQGVADPALVGRAIAGSYNAELDRAMASTLVGSREQLEVEIALAAIAARTTDPELKHTLEQG